MNRIDACSLFTASILTIVATMQLLLCCHPAYAQEPDSIDAAIAAIVAVDREGNGHEDAVLAAQSLSKLESQYLPRLLDAAKDTNPIVANWLRGIIFAVANSSKSLNDEMLENYIASRSNNVTGRAIAMELLKRSNPESANKLIKSSLDDPSLLIREMAVKVQIDKASDLAKGDQKTNAIKEYHIALSAARHPQQLASIVKSLSELGDTVTLAEAFSMILSWHSVGPFDNVGGEGYDTVYLPEELFTANGTIDLGASYKGKSGQVTWKVIESDNEKGAIDVAEAYEKEKGAVAYLYTEFDSPKNQKAQIRLSSKNANKVYLNGKEVMANHVYHSGGAIDQYIAGVDLQAGLNRILMKLCQNEQTESWAQEWQFQFRITDPNGAGL